MDWAIRMTDAEQLFLDDPRADAVLAKSQTANVAALLPSIKLRHAERISAELVIPARDGAYAELPTDLEPRLATALRGRGIDRLYSHQLRRMDCESCGPTHGGRDTNSVGQDTLLQPPRSASGDA